MTVSALRSGARIVCVPLDRIRDQYRTPDGVRGILDTLLGRGSWRAHSRYAKNAYVWLMSQHASDVSRVTETLPDVNDRFMTSLSYKG